MKSWVPNNFEAVELLYKSSCSAEVINHCKAVAELALDICLDIEKRGHYVNLQIVEIGALLHDIGRSKTHSVNHAIIGVEIAESFNIEPIIISIIEHHVGGGITQEEAKNLGWPNKSYIPTTLEEKIVAYADKMIEGDNRVPIERTISKMEEKLGKNHIALRMIDRLHREMSFLLKEDKTSI